MPADRPPIEHVTINVGGAQHGAAFYRAVLSTLGLQHEVDDHGRESYGPHGEFGVYDRQEAFHESSHVAFAASSPAEVDRFHEAAVAAGGTTLDPPRRRPEFGANVYSAYLLDPAGNGVEVIHRGE
jgi:catechol 2,3-dioxygenase-like lactoylglutathione lyase family enzyme